MGARAGSKGGASIRERLDGIDWPKLSRSILERGYARGPKLLEPRECAELAALYEDDRRFRKRIDMERHRFGVGDYSYFRDPLPRLFAELELAHGDGRFPRLFRSLVKADLLILDDWGPDRLNASQRRDLMEIVEDRYGAGSTLITSQLPINTWHDVIDEPTFADAILDRLVHNTYRLELDGPSMRKLKVGSEITPDEQTEPTK